MRQLAAPLKPLRLRLSVRPLGLAAILLVAIALALSADTTVQNLQSDPGLPRTRVAILLSCLAANLTLAWLRPILPLHERMSARVDRAYRALNGTVVVGGFLGLVALLTGDGARNNPVTTCAGFLGLSLAFGAFRPLLGILAPWVYAISGLAFGYRTTVGGLAHLSPWAWMVGHGHAAPQLGLCIAGLAAYALHIPKANEAWLSD